ncbi:MAG: L-aspartate oxidase [Ruminococcaceae bacterium]|nr:L-aspartate oxidase [Oscillospiraceae bacterium]
MRRYLYSGSVKNLTVLDYDVVIIGSGIAGLYAAINIDSSKRVALVTKSDFKMSNSYLAQGGIASVISPTDTFEGHIEDTLTAGAGLCDADAVRVLVEEGPENIRELVRLNVPFDTNPEGELMITREGGHSCRRIVHCGGDATGRETTKRLGQIVLERDNIDVLFNTFLIDILTEGNRISGVIVNDTNDDAVLRTGNVIIATGGIGHIYKYTTNPRASVGDGIACAVRAGAILENMEMVQFHPTTLISPKNSEKLFLISEAVRGEGGILENSNGEKFMKDKHPLKDLAPRDIVTRFILDELKNSGEKNVYLNVSSMSEEFFSNRFPTITDECRRFGINVPNDRIPVRPAQHYMMGGIKTDINGMTNIDGLYACGEAACTGIHGANRLASNSILECLVFGKRAADHINASNRVPALLEHTPFSCSDTKVSAYDLALDRETLRITMSQHAGPVRTANSMDEGHRIIKLLRNKYESMVLTTTEEYELCNMAITADAIFTAAKTRKDSIGAHYVIE